MAYTSKHSIPRAIFINSMDRENADYDKVISQLKEKYQTAICPVMLPIYEDGKFIGFSSLVTGKSYRYLDKFSKEMDTTPEMQEKIDEVWEEVTEAAASADDELMEKYFETGELTDEEKFRGLRKGTRRRRSRRVLRRGAAGAGHLQPAELHRDPHALARGKGLPQTRH